MSLVVEKFPVNPFPVNCYIAWDEESKDATIIDPGYIGEHEREFILDYIRKNGIKIKYILLTHMHFDHILSLADIREVTKAPIYGSKNDEFLLKTAKNQAAAFGFKLDFDDVNIDKYLNDKDEITLGEYKIIALTVPGHSPGSIVFYMPKAGIVFTGDVLFRQSIGRTDLPGGDFETLIEGIKKKLLTLPDDTIVYSGHGPETTISYEKKYNSFLK